jgi:hypothetical protein
MSSNTSRTEGERKDEMFVPYNLSRTPLEESLSIQHLKWEMRRRIRQVRSGFAVRAVSPLMEQMIGMLRPLVPPFPLAHDATSV